jgi:succinate dehydrogenase (ubiquinone) cytochrome b560 subunit
MYLRARSQFYPNILVQNNKPTKIKHSATANGNAKSPLEQQRLRRPVSPHLTIYKWEYQSLASILQRFSGIALSGSLYTFATAYLLLPSTMVDVDVLGSIVSAVATLPESLKIGGKFLLAWPFTYHAVNGVKQLAWDRVIGMRDKKMIRMVARGVAGVSFLGALGLALL